MTLSISCLFNNKSLKLENVVGIKIWLLDITGTLVEGFQLIRYVFQVPKQLWGIYPKTGELFKLGWCGFEGL